MPDAVLLAAALLVAGPVIGAACLLYPPLYPVWTAERERHLALVHAHPLGWTMVNVGFLAATLLTAAGLAVLAAGVATTQPARAVLVAGWVGYAVAGALWCVVIAIRNRTTPALARMVAAGTPTEPAETILGEAMSGLFTASMVGIGLSLVAIGGALALGGGIAAPVAWIGATVAALAVGITVARGDLIPAVLYLPTLLIGIALLAGWQ